MSARTSRRPGVPSRIPHRQSRRFWRSLGIVLCATLGAPAVVWVVPPGDHGGETEPRRTLSDAAVVAEHAGGVEVVWSQGGSSGAPSQAYRDPETGRWTAPPAGDLGSADPQGLSAATSTSAEGLSEEPMEGPRGGVRVSLRGRFRSALVAGRDDMGQVAVGCRELENERAAGGER